MDNTLIIYEMGDNGASGEGTLQGLANEVGVAANGVVETVPYLLSHHGRARRAARPTTTTRSAGRTRWTRRSNGRSRSPVHFGGTRNGLVISWPKRIKTGRRNPFASSASVIDIVPTILEAAGVEQPSMINGVKQTPIEGISLVYTFDDAKTPTRHKTQYFELLANRGVYSDGWMANTTPLRLPVVPSRPRRASPNPDDFKWELYNVAEDFSQSNDLAAQNPAKLKELQAALRRRRRRNTTSIRSMRRSPSVPTCAFVRASRAGGARSPTIRGRSAFPRALRPTRRTRTSPSRPTSSRACGADGVIITQGGRFGGWVLMIRGGKPEFDVRVLQPEAVQVSRRVSKDKLAPGKHTLRSTSSTTAQGYGKGGTGTLSVDGKQVAQGRIERTIPLRFSLDETLDVGMDTGTPVVEEYLSRMPFEFTGTLDRVVVKLGRAAWPRRDEKALKAAGERTLALPHLGRGPGVPNGIRTRFPIRDSPRVNGGAQGGAAAPRLGGCLVDTEYARRLATERARNADHRPRRPSLLELGAIVAAVVARLR